MPSLLPLHSGHPLSVDAAHGVSRRGFIGAGGVTLLGCLFAQACGGSTTGPNGGVVEPPPAGSTEFQNGILTVRLSLIPALTSANGHLVLSQTSGASRADLVIINVSGTYKAFSNICTHEGCTVTGYSGGRMICPCHGSEYNQNGQVVNGPAPSSLRQYAVTMNAAAQTLTIAV